MIKKKLPNVYKLPNPYNIPVHDQGGKNNCTSHSIASAIEYQLSAKLEERVLVDVDDLWEKQKRFGSATEETGDFIENALRVASMHGIKFTTTSGKKGTIYPSAKSIGTGKRIMGKGIVWD